MCSNRDAGEEIPGCFFNPVSGNVQITDDFDFCVPEQPQFRLRLYWEEGYVWQEDPDEQFFCMSHGWGQGNDLSCDRGQRHLQETSNHERQLKERDDDWSHNCRVEEWCWYGEEQQPCDPDRIYLDTCSGSDSRQRFYFDYLPSGEIMIRTVSRNKCLKGGRPRLE